MSTPDADVTMDYLEVPRMKATSFGVMHVDGKDNIISFIEKPADPPGIPDKPECALASMGIYVFRTKFLMEQLRRDAAEPESTRDFGKDIIPYIVEHGKAIAHRFNKSCVRRRPRTRPTGAMSARSMPTGKPNIDLTDITPNSTSTTATGRSGPMPS